MWGWNGHMGWGMGLSWVVGLVLIGIVFWFALSAARRGGNSAEETPEQAVKRRYARGEIDRETYRRMLEELRK